MSLFKELLARATPRSTTRIFTSRTEPRQYVVPDKQYVRVWLRAAWVVEVRRWATKFHATVHGRFAYNDLLQGPLDVVSVVAPDKSFEELNPANLDRLIVVNQPLLGPVPYRGELSMEVGLFSVAAGDLAKPCLNLPVELTNTASVAFLGQAKAFVEPIRRGAEFLFSQKNQAELEIGLSRTDVELRSGNIAVARVPKGEFNPGNIRLDPADYRLLGKDGQPLTHFPYRVLGIEASSEAAHCAAVPDVRTGWEAVRQAAARGPPAEEVRQRFDEMRHAYGFRRISYRQTSRVSSPNSTSNYRRPATVLRRRASTGRWKPYRRCARYGMRACASGTGSSQWNRDIVAEGPADLDGTAAIVMRDPDVPDIELQRFFAARPQNSRPLAPAVIPDPARVYSPGT